MVKGFFEGRRELRAAQDELAEITRELMPAQSLFGDVPGDMRIIQDGEVFTGLIDDATKWTDKALIEKLGDIHPRYAAEEEARITHLTAVSPTAHRAETVERLGYDPVSAAVIAEGYDPSSKKGQELAAQYAVPIEDTMAEINQMIQEMRER